MIQQTHPCATEQSDSLSRAEDVWETYQPLNPFNTNLRCNLYESQFAERGFLSDWVLQEDSVLVWDLSHYFLNRKGWTDVPFWENTHFPLIRSQTYDTTLAFSMQAMMSTTWPRRA